MKHYAMSDIHGNYKLLQKALNYCSVDDVIYFLGDAIDRGLQSLECFMALLTDPRVTYLRGNHEDIMHDTLEAIMENQIYQQAFLENWYENGGDITYAQIRKLYNKEDYFILINMIDKMPMDVTYGRNGRTVYLNHCGFTPKVVPHYTYVPLWDRNHLNDLWPDEANANTYVVHGHTPVQFLYLMDITDNQEIQPVTYCDGHKIDIDLGTPSSHKCCLLDLDTMEAKIFYDTL